MARRNWNRIGILIVLSMIMFTFVVSAENLYENYTTGDDSSDTVYGARQRAQTIYVGAGGINESFVVTHIDLKLLRVGNPGTLNISLKGVDSTGAPNETVIRAGTYDGNTLTTDAGGGWYEVTMNPKTRGDTTTFQVLDGTGSSLSGVTVYMEGNEGVLKADGNYSVAMGIQNDGGDASNYFKPRFDATAPTYLGGQWYESADSGVTWVAQAYDIMFKFYGNNASDGFYDLSSGTTDGAGGVTFSVNREDTYRFTFVKDGYSNYTLTLSSPQDSYTINMLTSTASGNFTDYSAGISYFIAPDLSNLANDTNYTFNFTIDSDYWGLEEFGFSLRNSSDYYYFNVTSFESAGGNVNESWGTDSLDSLTMEYYWVIDGNTTNFTRTWYVSETIDEGFGLNKFFTDLKTYTDEGIFGLNVFTRTLLIFVFIFIVAGLLSYASGIYSPAAIMTFIFAMVFFFDYVLGLIPNPLNSRVLHLASILVGAIALTLIIREGR